MGKNLEEMSERELLIEIAKLQRKEARSGKVAAVATVVLALVLVLALGAAVPVVFDALGQMGDALAEVEQVAKDAQDSLKDVDVLVGNLNIVLEDNMDALNKTLTQVGEIDVESLNKSIEELGAILEPLAKLFKR